MEFTEELAAFRARTADPGYSGLILLGTKQSTTAALLLGTLKVQRVAFLLTRETQSMPKDVAELLGVSPDDWLCPTGDYSTITSVYRGLKNILNVWHELDHAQIAVDLTGGLKPMSIGLEKAAYVLKIPTLYVQSTYRELPDGRSVPIPGTQWLETPPDPYTVFGDLEADEAKRLYRNHDYSGAARIFAELAERVDGTDGMEYRAFASLAKLYAAWDALDFAAAAREADALLAMPLAEIRELAAHTEQLRYQANRLHELATVSRSVGSDSDEDKLRTLKNAESIVPLLGTLHAAALRRAAQGRYDFAALFRYRCLELISQHRLAEDGLLTNTPDYKVLENKKKLAPGMLKTKFKEVQIKVAQERGKTKENPKGLPGKVALFDGYMLLAALDDPLVRDYPLSHIEDTTNARNQSVLAHGYRLIRQDEYDKFANVVEAILTRLFANVLHDDRNEWEQQYQFVQPWLIERLND